ncbi:MAG TPA: radical SAM family heme chaperone HemW [Bacillota bacterium]|nr:radical SAM family heme chaperone HemW [Bacillota bacterium]
MTAANKTDLPDIREGNPGGRALGLYFHIPFCVRKCDYCDFLSFGGISEEDQRSYFRALIREIEYWARVYNNKYYVDTVFIGGGTPSLVGESLVSGLMAAIRDNFNVRRDAEISIESNPKTLTENKLNAYLEAGINRLSIGAQSLEDELLGRMGRIHTAEDFLTNYTLARECGFRNINIDLMFSIPGQTMGTWMETLGTAIGLAPEHISFYSLQIEEGTPFFTMFQDGIMKETDDELDRRMYHDAVDALWAGGYGHYEVSNAARPGCECRHNLKYWSMDDYLGLGLGAHSFIEGTRFSNTAVFKEYIQAGGEAIDRRPHLDTASPFVCWSHKNTEQDTIAEFLFTGLRKIKGVDLKEFEKRFGQSIEAVYSANWSRIQRYLAEGFLIRSGDNLRLSEKGIDISNAVLAEFV